ncbi:hypothetical protein QNJ39_03760 [Macrococcus caseolyticus]|uniref:hypothetical protein n=1 Tax=Macrococcoides caseolyticum TaxID=69966 RepID=UPI0024BC06A1|nr:hypothetical protein [Macrococcus caseolyticus]MDJ1090700.1 hypothetical protein [Macrococcus caseolyticus]
MINVSEFINHKAFDGQREINDGTQYGFLFDNEYGASVVNHSFSYTNGDDEWELAVLKNGRLTYDTHITDDVIGHLKVVDVLKILDEIERL